MGMFILGAVVGGCIGIGTMSIFAAGGKSDNCMECRLLQEHVAEARRKEESKKLNAREEFFYDSIDSNLPKHEPIRKKSKAPQHKRY